MKRISLLLLAFISGHSADVTYPIAITDTVVIAGAAPTTNSAGQVKIGGGLVWAKAAVQSSEYYALNPTENHFVRLYRNGTQSGIYTDDQTKILLQEYGGAVAIGVDPGGSELLRVGGDVRASGGFNSMTNQANGSYGTLITNTNSSSYLSTTAMGTTGHGVAGWAKSLVIEGVPSAGGNTVLSSYSGDFIIQTGARAERMRIDSSGNVRTSGRNTHLGTIPLTLGYSANGYPDVGFNIYRDTTANQTRINADSASKIDFGNNGRVSLMIAPTGAAASAITWSTAWMVDAATGTMTIIGAAPTAASDGTVKIGGGRMMVGGTISAKEIKVTTTGADYVFEDGYKLRSLAEVEQFIAKEKRLPEMMSAKEMQAEGMPVSEVVTKQLAKIEELTLYAIAQKKETEAARAEAIATRTEVTAARAEAVATRAEATAVRAELNDLKNRMERLEKALANR